MRTLDIIKGKIRSKLGNNESMPPFPAIYTLLCEEIDRLKDVPIRQPILKPHEQAIFDRNMGTE